MLLRWMNGITALVALVAQTAFAGGPINHVYVVGDSLSDQGNLLFATGILGPQYQPPLPPVPDVSRYFQGRFSNGPNYVDILTAKLGTTAGASELGGTNYAFGGSRTDYNRAEALGIPYLPDGFYPVSAYPWSLDEQVATFLQDAAASGVNPNGLYIVFHGSNDLADALAGLRFGEPPSPKIAKAVQGVLNAVAAYKSVGARRILVMLSPDLALVPGVIALGPQAIFLGNQFSTQFNDAVKGAIGAMQDPTIVVFDTAAFMHAVFANPAAYELTNVTSACYGGYVYPSNLLPCSDPEHYAFWDKEHPTTRLDEIFAEEVFTNVLHCTKLGDGKSRAQCAGSPQ